jgi:integrase
MSIKKFHKPNCTGGACDCPWRLDYRPLGMSGPHKRINFPTRKEAERHRAETQVKVSRNEYISPAAVPLFSKVAQEWLLEKADRHPATKLEAANVLRHLSPLNQRRLDQINVSVIEKLRDDLVQKQGGRRLSPRSVARMMGSLAAIFKVAMRKGYVTSNPAAVALRPRNPVREVKDASEAETGAETGALRPDEVLSSEEIGRLLDHAEPGLWRTYIAVAAACGLRSEEINALAWGAVELSTGKLYVKRSLAWTRDAGETGTVKPRFFGTKTRSGKRTLPLAPELVSLLRAWKIQCPPSKDDLVFTETGEPLRRSRVLAGGIHPACRRAGLRQCSVKSLRHSYASGLLARSAAITTVAGLMGHSSPMITLRTYSHWIPSEDRGEAKAYAAGFLGNTSQRIVAQMQEATGTLVQGRG